MAIKISDKVKENFMETVKNLLEANGEEVLKVKSGTYSIPWASGEDEGYINITFSIPKGERGGDGYDGHTEAENYEHEMRVKAQKKAEAEAKKQAKAAKDKASREAKAKAKEKGE